jgi:hypothetical protein
MVFSSIPLKISAKMTPLIVTLALFLDAVYGAAHPAITSAAQLVERQNLGIGTIWSPSLVGTDISCK